MEEIVKEVKRNEWLMGELIMHLEQGDSDAAKQSIDDLHKVLDRVVDLIDEVED